MRPDDEPVDRPMLTQPGQNVLDQTVNARGPDRVRVDSTIKVERFVGRAVDDDQVHGFRQSPPFGGKSGGSLEA
jgi:hypothetical protein